MIKKIIIDVIASFLIGISIIGFALEASFAPGGVNGMAVLINYLTHLPIGWLTLFINLPIILFTYKQLGKVFFLYSFKTMIISSLFIDYVVCFLPSYHGSRLFASIFSGIFAGIGYSLIFNAGSSTGGTDFIIVALQRKNPHLSLGLLTFIIDGTIIIGSIFVYHDFYAFIYGLVYTIVTSLFLDLTSLCIRKLHLFSVA